MVVEPIRAPDVQRYTRLHFRILLNNIKRLTALRSLAIMTYQLASVNNLRVSVNVTRRVHAVARDDADGAAHGVGLGLKWLPLRRVQLQRLLQDAVGSC